MMYYLIASNDKFNPKDTAIYTIFKNLGDGTFLEMDVIILIDKMKIYTSLFDFTNTVKTLLYNNASTFKDKSKLLSELYSMSPLLTPSRMREISSIL